jgi:hypothetical protein
VSKFVPHALMILLVLNLAGCAREESATAPRITPLSAVAAFGSAEPHLAMSAGGNVVMSWLEPRGDGVVLKWSQLNDTRWSDPISVASGSDWFVNWADFPSVEPIDTDLWAAHWLVKRPGGTFAYDVAIAISADGGQTWGQPVTPHEDGTPTEHGFVSLFPGDDGVAALWLDGRNMQPSVDGHGHGGMTLRSAVVSPVGDLGHKAVVDELVCDCCQTDVTLTSSGPVAVYRNRTEGEIRDIYVARLENGQWHAGVPVTEDGWEIAGCPVNGPAIDASEDDVAVAWFTAAKGDTKVRFARSADAGKSFGTAIDIATDRPIGRVDTVLLEDGSALVSWLRSTNGSEGEICIQHVKADGKLGDEIVVATTAAGRMSGFPQMALQGKTVVVAWTDVVDEATQVRTARVEVP